MPLTLNSILQIVTRMISITEPSCIIHRMINITEEQERDIKLKAKRENKHEAEVIRELLSEGMKKIHL